MHEPDKFILAIVKIADGFAHEPRYVRGSLQDHEPDFKTTMIQFDLRPLIEHSKAPA